jgi:hypothetical protein
MIGEPRSNCRDLAIWKQGYDPPPLEIADNRSVTAIASKGPIVDADDGQRMGSSGCPPSYNPKQRIVADRQISRLAKLAAGLPPSANPKRWTMHSSRAVLRDRVGRTLSPNRSAKIRRRQ